MSEALALTINALTNVLNNQLRPDGTRATWFLAFGSLLWFVRDRERYDRPFATDLDIIVNHGEVDPAAINAGLTGYGFVESKRTLDRSGNILEQVFSSTDPRYIDCDIDIWYQVEAQGFCFHGLPYTKEAGTTLFKGVASWRFHGGVIAYPFPGAEVAPPIYIPEHFGSLLGAWYPPQYDAQGNPIPCTGWISHNPEYGQSKCEIALTVKDIRELQSTMMVAAQV